MCSGSEAGSYLKLIDLVYHSTLGLRVIKKKNGVFAETVHWNDSGTHRIFFFFFITLKTRVE